MKIPNLLDLGNGLSNISLLRNLFVKLSLNMNHVRETIIVIPIPDKI